MKCERFESRLDELLDARVAPEDDAALCEHAGLCPSCRTTLATHVQLMQAVSQLPRPSVSDDLAARVLGELRRPVVASREAGRSYTPWYALAVAAALLLAAWPLVALWQSAGRVEVAQTDAPSAAVDASADDAPAMPLDQLLRDASDKYAVLARESTDVAAAAPQPLERPVVPTTSEDPAVQALTAVSWVQEVSDGLRPITTSTTGALSFLLQAFHTNEMQTRS